MKRLAIAVLAAPVLTVFGAAVIVQGFIFWRTDSEANAATDAWMTNDFRLWAQELRSAKRTR